MTSNTFSDEKCNEYVLKTHTPYMQSIRGRRGETKSSGGGRLVDPRSDRQNKPWKNMAISRATYYRRKKNGSEFV